MHNRTPVGLPRPGIIKDIVTRMSKKVLIGNFSDYVPLLIEGKVPVVERVTNDSH